MSAEVSAHDTPGGWLWQCIELHALQPGTVAVRTADERYTYADLVAGACAASDELYNLRPGATVGVLALKSVDTIFAVLACARLGHPTVLISPDLPELTRQQIFRAAQVECYVDGSGPHVTNFFMDSPWTPHPGGDCSDHPLLILTTSGSTGAPKCARLPAGAVQQFVAWAGATFGIHSGTSVLSLAPLNFDLSLLEVWATLCHGATVTMIADHLAVRSQHVSEMISRNQINVIQGVPTLLDVALEQAGERTFESVDHVIMTGEEAPAQLIGRVRLLFPAAALHNVYGATETNDSFIYTVPSTATTPLPIGSPISGVEALLRDAAGHVVEGVGQGELYVASPFVADGYTEANLTRVAFVHPREDERVFFRTGDVVRRDNSGIYHYVGRGDRQVKIRGVTVNLDAIEKVLAQHPDVIECAVALANTQGRASISAAVVVNDIHLPDSVALRLHCAARLPRAAVPSKFDVRRELLPRTGTGKIDRRAAIRT